MLCAQRNCLLLLLLVRLTFGASIAQHSHAGPSSSPTSSSAAALAVPGTGEAFQNGITIEMLRFVTPYGRGWESLVDLTPYSPALRTAVDALGEMSFYSFIDTWVNNGTGKDYLYVSNTSGACYKGRHSDGNGWMLDAELIFWPIAETKLDSKDTRPHSSVTLAAGPTGGISDIGTTSIHEGFLSSRGEVTLGNAAYFAHVDRAMVYRCKGSEDIRQAAVFGRTQLDIAAALLSNKPRSVDFITKRFFTYFALALLRQIQVSFVDHERKIVHGSCEISHRSLEKHMPVFLSPWDAFTDEFYGNTTWLNSSYPLKPVGTLLEVSDCSSSQVGDACRVNVTMHLTGLEASCFPRKDSLMFPGLFVPSQAGALEHAQNLARSMRRASEAVARESKAHAGKLGVDQGPTLLEFNISTFQALPMLGEVDLTASLSNAVDSKVGVVSLFQDHTYSALLRGRWRQRSAHDTGLPASVAKAVRNASRTTSTELQDQEHVCVVAQRHQGRFFQRTFDMSTLSPKDSVILQLVITGHGWEATTEQCGEYCHAIYQLSINQQRVANITQWRDDCNRNPLGEQDGTWRFARNGWCPGSAQPGLFIDISKALRTGSNLLTMDLVVRSSLTGVYGPYVDHSGFSQKEIATLIVGATLFVYGENVVRDIRAQAKAFTPAELAVRQGCSDPQALHPSKTSVQNTVSAVDNRPLAIGDIKYSMSSYFDRLAITHVGRDPMTAFHESALDSVDRMRNAWARNLTGIHGDIDFQAKAPWHLLHEEDQVDLSGGHRVKVFSDLLIQGRNRWNLAKVEKTNIPKDWARVSLRVRLSPPKDGLKIDAWDRAGSFGIHINEMAAQNLKTGAANSDAGHLPEVQVLSVASVGRTSTDPMKHTNR